MLGLFKCEQEGSDRHRKQHQAEGIGAPLMPLRWHARQPRHQHERDQPDRDVDEEDRLPAEMLGEIAARHRAERIGGDRHRGDIALVAGTLARRDRLTDQCLRQRHQPAAAQPLQHARERQPFDGRRHRAAERRPHEYRDRDEHQVAAAQSVAEPAVERRRDGRRDQIADDDPGRALDLAGRRGNRRQGGRDDRLVDDRQEHGHHDRRKDRQEAAVLRRGRGCTLFVLVRPARHRCSVLMETRGRYEPKRPRRSRGRSMRQGQRHAQCVTLNAP